MKQLTMDQIQRLSDMVKSFTSAVDDVVGTEKTVSFMIYAGDTDGLEDRNMVHMVGWGNRPIFPAAMTVTKRLVGDDQFLTVTHNGLTFLQIQ